jgi:hypothetical protein
MKKKMNLDELRVKSFVTDLGASTAETINGGYTSIITDYSTILVSVYCDPDPWTIGDIKPENA